MFDFVTILFQLVNMKAAMLGVAAAQAWAYFTPAQDGEHPDPFSTKGGGWRARAIPVISPVIAIVATIVLEWDNSFIPDDAARGLISGFASEWMLRVYYKTVKGL
jgi:hypothetical protein